jgi:hypothetical protein
MTVYAYSTPIRRDTVEVGATIFFSGSVAVKPFEAEETILYPDRAGMV